MLAVLVMGESEAHCSGWDASGQMWASCRRQPSVRTSWATLVQWGEMGLTSSFLSKQPTEERTFFFPQRQGKGLQVNDAPGRDEDREAKQNPLREPDGVTSLARWADFHPLPLLPALVWGPWASVVSAGRGQHKRQAVDGPADSEWPWDYENLRIIRTLPSGG